MADAGASEKKKLGEMLLDAGLIDEVQLAVALGHQKDSGTKLGVQLLQLGFISEKALSEFLKDQTDISISLIDRRISKEAINSLPKVLAYKYRIMPVAFDGKTIVIATANPTDLDMLDDLAFQTGKKVHVVRALEWDIDNALIKYYQHFSEEELTNLSTDKTLGEQYKNAVWALDNEAMLDRQIKDKALQQALPPSQSQQRPATTPAAKPAARPFTPLPPKLAPVPPSPAAPVGAPAEAPSTDFASYKLDSSGTRKFSLQHAMLELLIEKGIFTDAELRKKLMELERAASAE